MIELINISKKYGDQNTVYALTNITLSFPDKGLVSIIGKSGSGKSTLLNILSGIIFPTDGNYLIDGKDTKTFNSDTWNQVRNNYFGYVFQDHNLIDYLTVYENLKLIETLSANDEPLDQEINRILTKLDIKDLLNKKVSNLSGGEQQRVAIARALLKKSKIILADEPTGSLDLENSINIFEILKEISKDVLVILITHDIEFAEKYSDFTVKLDYGKLKTSTLPIKDLSNHKTSFTVTSSKIKLKQLVQTSLKINKTFKFKSFFMMFFMLMTLSSLMFTLAFNLFEESPFLYHANKGTSNQQIYISNNEMNLVIPDTYDDLDFSAFTNLSFNKVYVEQLDTTLMSLFNVNSLQKIFRTIEVRNDLLDDEIIITDYQATMLRENNITLIDSYENLIDTFIILGDYSFKIKDVMLTNFNEDFSTQFQDRLLTTYDVLKMNQNTFVKLVDHLNNDIEMTTDLGLVNFVNRVSLVDIDESSFIGSLDLLPNEVILTVPMLILITNGTFEVPADMEPYLDTSFDLTYVKNGNEVTENFTIKAIIFKDNHAIFFESNFFETEIKPDTLDLDLLQYTYTFSEYDLNSFIEFHQYIKSIGLEFTSYIAFDAMRATVFVTGLNTFLIIFTNVSFILLIAMLFFFIKSSVNDHLYNIGILKSLGFLNKHIMLIFSFMNLMIIGITYMLSTIIFLINVNLINTYYKEELEMNINLINLDFTLFLYTGLTVLLIGGLISFISLERIKKIEILKLLKN